jgi:hypothetical protein
MATISDPPTYWRDQLRAILSAGGDVAALDPLLELTGPPDMPLKGLSEDLRTVTVDQARPTFAASTWRTRMWTCLRVGLPTPPANTGEAEAYPSKQTRVIRRTCESCGMGVPFSVPARYMARLVISSRLRTFQRRMRMAHPLLGLSQVQKPICLYVRPGDRSGTGATFVAWRFLEEGTYRLTTDPYSDLDNFVKGVQDSLQGAKGTPGLLRNDRLVQLLIVGRTQKL